VLGENFLDVIKGTEITSTSVGVLPLTAGFLAAFITGILACMWMIRIVRNSKLIYFAIYTLVVGILAIILA
jgi:undecaprenyl-diphosphatase